MRPLTLSLLVSTAQKDVVWTGGPEALGDLRVWLQVLDPVYQLLSKMSWLTHIYTTIFQTCIDVLVGTKI